MATIQNWPDVRDPSPAGGARFRFRWDRRFAALARALGVVADSCYVEVGTESFEARFGPWRVQTPLENVASVQITGPYRWWKVAGPARLSLGDLGLTFASTTAPGVCIRFRQPVAGGDPMGCLRHPGLTVTVDNPDGLVAALAGRSGPPTSDDLRWRLTQGAVAGVAATLAMTPVMPLARRAFHDFGAIAPEAITRRGLGDMARRRWLAGPSTAIAHLGFGAMGGALFAMLAGRLPGPRVVRGVAFGLAVMGVSYEGWVPAAGIVSPLHRPPWGRSVSIVASHLLYGAMLGKLVAPPAGDG